MEAIVTHRSMLICSWLQHVTDSFAELQFVILVPQGRLVTVVSWAFHPALLDILDDGVQTIGVLNVKYQGGLDGGAFEYVCSERSVLVVGAAYLKDHVDSWLTDEM
jgi:hypothetical protein